VPSRTATFTESSRSTTAPAAASDSTAVVLNLDEDAFRGFYERTSRVLWGYLHRLTGSPHQADDLLQEAYYRLLRTDTVLETETHRRQYLFRIATNLVRDRIRRGRTQPEPLGYDEAGEPGIATGSEAALTTHLDLSAAMGRLRARERALLWLAYGQGASHVEIAGIVGVKPGSVKALLLRARRRLAGLLGRTERSS
jgi:RNA polymerase sigma-70 factor (ECF subfamily)